MRIAVCISGQPRTWKKCYETWFDLLSRFGNEVDYFYHLWNFNSMPPRLGEEAIQPVTTEELDEFHNTINPKKFMIEDYNTSIKSREDIWITGKDYPLSGGTVVYWTASQFYSHMRAAHLKRQYEIENNFEYDICFRMRTDLFFSKDELDNKHANFIKDFKPQPNTFYSCHTNSVDSFPFVRVGDLFYFCDSITFDKISQFYRFLPVIGTNPFKNLAHCPPEVPLAFFIKMLRLDIYDSFFDPRVMRTDEYFEKLGVLGNHELI
jgi:hypothetical protein